MEKIRFIEIKGKKIEVSEDVYKAYMQPIWKENKKQYRAYKNLEDISNQDIIQSSNSKLGRFSQVGTFSSDFMPTKEYGLPLSLETAFESSGFEIESSDDIESIVTSKLIFDAFLDLIKNFPEKHQEIIKLVYIYEMTERDVANELGVSQKTVNNVKRKYLPIIQEELKPWRNYSN